ncbi:hypothetical protein FOZ60_013396 [Perkinsus olseni]|uniref:Uncharacterized protein n=1 Tax=Perkinsus olseni TaxID=32597 RepID=A0A7J6PAQ4_PEROL|nr:hypothetical protein FOZ60_013396 [Perkinsus olseni]
MREVSAETEISVRTLRRYQGEAGRLSLCKWWSDKRASLGTSVDDFFYCASHARLWIRGEVTAASSAVVFGKAPTPAHLYRCGDPAAGWSTRQSVTVGRRWAARGPRVPHGTVAVVPRR